MAGWRKQIGGAGKQGCAASMASAKLDAKEGPASPAIGAIGRKIEAREALCYS